MAQSGDVLLLDDGELGRTEIYGKDNLAGDHISRIRIDVDMASRADRMRLVRPGDLIDKLQNPRHAEPGILPHRHRRGAGMAVPAGDRNLRPAQALSVSNDADIFLFGFEDRSLLDILLAQYSHHQKSIH